MKRRYLLLVALVALAAVAVSALARLPRTSSSRTTEAAPLPRVDLVLAIENGRLSPESAAVPKGHLVRLRVSNHGTTPTSVQLVGYEDRVTMTSLAPGATWAMEFIADRPGDDFAWLVDDRPAGRLAVTGSHLLEGHR